MKRIMHILVAVVTCVCVLTANILPAYAAGNDYSVNCQGYEFYLDEYGSEVYDYPIELDPEILTYDMLEQMGLFVSGVDGTSAIDLSYVIEENVPNLQIVEGSGAAVGGSAVAGGSAVGTTAFICGLSTGQVVLIAILVAAGVLILTEPELVETTINDIWTYIDHNTQLRLNEMYFQETWLIDEEIAGIINGALSDVVFMQNGVIWSKSLIISTDDLTGLTTTYPTDRIVVENQPEDALTVDYTVLELDKWTTIDKSGTILYKISRSPRWNSSGTALYDADPSQSVMNCYLLTIYNTATGVKVSFYPNTDVFWSNRTALIAPPVFINDGEKMGMEVVFGIKSATSTFYTFWGQTINYNMSYTHPWLMTGTGTELDGKVLLDVTYNSETGMWKYKYKPYGASYNNNTTIVEFPFEPFFWVYSPSEPDTNQTNSGALKVIDTEQDVDEFGKIETNTNVEIPQVGPMSVPALNTDEVVTTDPDTGDDVVTDVAILPGTEPVVNPDGTPPLDKLNPENPSLDGLKGWINAIFNLEHLFDWLPERYSVQFDAVISFLGSVIIVMFVYMIIKIFF